MRSNPSRSRHRIAVLLAILAVGGSAAAAASSLFGAQGSTAPVRNRAAVILLDRLEVPANVASRRPAGVPSPRAIVVRRPSQARGAQNLILVTRETRADDLDKAVSQLMTSIRRTPQATTEMRAYVSPARANPAAAKDRARAINDLRRLASAREHQFTGIGRHKAITIRLKGSKASTPAAPPNVPKVWNKK